jgi:hypothetical protein
MPPSIDALTSSSAPAWPTLLRFHAGRQSNAENVDPSVASAPESAGIRGSFIRSVVVAVIIGATIPPISVPVVVAVVGRISRIGSEGDQREESATVETVVGREVSMIEASARAEVAASEPVCSNDAVAAHKSAAADRAAEARRGRAPERRGSTPEGGSRACESAAGVYSGAAVWSGGSRARSTYKHSGDGAGDDRITKHVMSPLETQG